MECIICGDTGWAMAYRQDEPLAEFGFICTSCPTAKVKKIKEGKGASFWTDSLAFEGWALRRQEVDHAWCEAIRNYYKSSGIEHG